MAHIDNLIDSIKDPQLRTALRTEYDKVTKSRRVGLVFDRHLPESVVLPGFAIRAGEKVQVLADGSDDPADLDGSGVWTVTDVGAVDAQLRDGNGDSRQVPKAQLVATREFGDPIYPGLVSTGRVVRGGGDGDDGGRPFHTVINAENFHALEALLFAHEGQVDAIYIDPPYNTGARDWKYNNDYVDDADPYRHSKWLSFMEKRLLLARRLLNPEGSVLIVTIDEKEVHRLALLLEQTFPVATIQMVTSVISAKGAVRPGRFSRVEEHVLYVTQGDARLTPQATNMLDLDRVGVAEGDPIEWLGLRRREPSSKRGARPNQFYPIYVDAETGQIHSIGPALDDDVDRAGVPVFAGTVALWPLDSRGRETLWGLTPDALRTNLSDGFVRVNAWKPGTRKGTVQYLPSGTIEQIRAGRIVVTGRKPDGSVLGHRADGATTTPPKRVWNVPTHNAESGGTRMLEALVTGRRFPYPKSLYAVEDALRFYLDDRPEALVLDFFAGSGTTTHAVMRLNARDNGRRRSISVTNNEVSAEEARVLRDSGHAPGSEEWESLGICRYITTPRIVAAVTGRTLEGDAVRGTYSTVPEDPIGNGFAENVEFLSLTYEDATLVSLGRRFEAIAPLLWLRAGAAGARIDHVADEGWAIPPGAIYGILFDTTVWGAFVAATARRDDLTHVFIVTDSLVEYQQIVARLDPALPTTRLYADYLRSFEINTRA